MNIMKKSDVHKQYETNYMWQECSEADGFLFTQQRCDYFDEHLSMKWLVWEGDWLYNYFW